MSTAETLSREGPRLGAIIAGKYRVDGVIGDGGMGLVLRAHHLELDTEVAVKIARPGLAQREEVVQRMLLESRIAAKIRSEHVVKVLDAGRLPSGVPYIAMEYLEGQDLSDVLQREGRLPVEQAVDFMVQACDALGEAHAAGIVHRDLKPENLFLTARGDGSAIIKVLDFGISKHLGDVPRHSGITNPSVAVGSPHYMAPEQMRAWPDVDVRADVWALGAILYELLTGVSPFEAETLAAVCARVLGGEPVSPRLHDPTLPQGLEHAVLRCLAKPREQRFLNVAELALALAPFGPSSAAAYAERITRVVLGKPVSSSRLLPRPPTSSPSNPLTPSLPLEWRRVSPITVLPIVDGESSALDPPPDRTRRALVVGVSIASGVALAGALWATRLAAREAPAVSHHEPAIVRAWQPPALAFAPASPSKLQPREADSQPPKALPVLGRKRGGGVARTQLAPRAPALPAAAIPRAEPSPARSATLAFDTTDPKPPTAGFENRREPDAWNPESFGGRK